MTRPDHVVEVAVPSLGIEVRVVLEQKLRFGSRQDAFADGSTYVKHLRDGLGSCKAPDRKAFHADKWFDDALKAVRTVLLKVKKGSTMPNSGTVPHVCFASILTPPRKIIVADKENGTPIECDAVGFLPPTVNVAAFSKSSPHLQIVQRAKVCLWLGLDSLIRQCSESEVEAAWTCTIDELTESIHRPWKKEQT